MLFDCQKRLAAGFQHPRDKFVTKAVGAGMALGFTISFMQTEEVISNV